MERQGSYDAKLPAGWHGDYTNELKKGREEKGYRYVKAQKGSHAFHGGADCGQEIFPPFSTK